MILSVCGRQYMSLDAEEAAVARLIGVTEAQVVRMMSGKKVRPKGAVTYYTLTGSPGDVLYKMVSQHYVIFPIE